MRISTIINNNSVASATPAVAGKIYQPNETKHSKWRLCSIAVHLVVNCSSANVSQQYDPINEQSKAVHNQRKFNVIIMCANLRKTDVVLSELSNTTTHLLQDVVAVAANDARASTINDTNRQSSTATGIIDNDACAVPPIKKRKTRRGKSKRGRSAGGAGGVISTILSSSTIASRKPEAPHNSNQFLLEDHGNIDVELDEHLLRGGGDMGAAGARNNNNNRDSSSFSMDSDGEFYSSPDDEEQFLIKDFDDQYESVQAERLQSMSKSELIQEYLALESKVETLTTRHRKIGAASRDDLQREIERLVGENENLKRENDMLRAKMTAVATPFTLTDSEDSETDSSDSCGGSSTTTTTSSNSSHNNNNNSDDDDDGKSSGVISPLIDYVQTNGHSAETNNVASLVVSE